MPDVARSRFQERLLFALNFFRHPFMLGSIWPSSKYLVDEVLRPVDWTRAKVIVEYGPGVGTITDEIVKRMSADTHLVVIETNPTFVKFLRGEYQNPRFHVAFESAANVDSILKGLGLPLADYIISGIPLGSMPEALRIEIVTKTRAALVPGGQFLVYQFTARVLPQLQMIFREVRRGMERRNIPPAHLFVCAMD